MEIVANFTRLLSRFRYPVSLPEDVARDLGVRIPNTVDFCFLLRLLRSSDLRLTKFKRYMPRTVVESAFSSALKKEHFRSSTLFSYYFNKSWLVFALYFDEGETLRRFHVQCPSCSGLDGFDIHLEEGSEWQQIAAS